MHKSSRRCSSLCRTGMARLDREVIVIRLIAFADLYAARKGYRFGEGAEGAKQHIQNKLTEAAGKITVKQEQAGAHAPPVSYEIRQRVLDEDLAAAERGIEIFVDRMIEARPYHYPEDPEGVIIGERTFWSAFNTLCPIFPFC
jgi:hypothetical protein